MCLFVFVILYFLYNKETFSFYLCCRESSSIILKQSKGTVDSYVEGSWPDAVKHLLKFLDLA